MELRKIILIGKVLTQKKTNVLEWKMKMEFSAIIVRNSLIAGGKIYSIVLVDDNCTFKSMLSNN